MMTSHRLPIAASLLLLVLVFPVSLVAGDDTRGPDDGVLLIVGGGGKESASLFRKFVELAGGSQARIVVVSTALSSRPDFDYQNPGVARFAREKLKLPHLTVLHTHDRAIADTREFVRPLREADAVWFTGGRQWRLADAYLGTRTEREFHRVLKRGGAIGGSSAGASIQADFLVRGDSKTNRVMIGDHQRGFGFLENCAIDQHVIPRNRQKGLVEVLTDPDGLMDRRFDREDLLGIGIDEDSAILVRKDSFEVVGKCNARVLVYNPRSWTDQTTDVRKYRTLWLGARYDLKHRRVLDPGPAEPVAGRPRGFYKDLFMSSGVRLTSRKQLHAAESLGLSYEYYAGKDAKQQNELISGTPGDTNGVLLYPDGQPRFRMIYVNGGGATSHGKSLEKNGRNILRRFYNTGGSYCGSCAGSFFSGRNVDTSTKRRLGYLHIFPHNTLNTGLKKERVGHSIPENSPLLLYRDFGPDRYVGDIYHNNGNWLSMKTGPHLKDTQMLAIYDTPGKKPHEGAAIWAYKKNPRSGRVVNIGSHPEGIKSGKRLALTEACFLYALDGTGTPAVKGTLESGVARVMDKRTEDKQPALTRIGDRQFHHFRFTVPAERTRVTINVDSDADCDLHVFLRKGSPAFRGCSCRADTSTGSSKTFAATLEPGTWFVSVECASTVEAKRHESGSHFVYTGNTAVLNGLAYRITMTCK